MGRPRSRTVAIVAVVAIVAIVATWALWRARRTAAPGDGFGPTISLRVNSDRRADIVAGTPLLFAVSLTSLDERDGLDSGLWTNLIRLVQGESDSMPWPVSVLGAPRIITSQPPDGTLARLRVERPDAGVSAQGQVRQVWLAVPPEAMATAAPGTYEIRARLEQPSGLPWRRGQTLTSAPVIVVVLPAPPARSERERLALSARYYLLAKRPEEARQAAWDLVGLDPKDVGAAMLLGDALAALGRKPEALTAYRAALANSPRSYESPILLYERIESVSK